MQESIKNFGLSLIEMLSTWMEYTNQNRELKGELYRVKRIA